MKRADVKIGTEYAVRRGNYGSAARVLIEGEAKREHRVYGSGFSDRRATERCFKGKLIEGYYNGREFGMAEGKVGFVRPRDVLHEWTVQAASIENDARLKADRERMRREDEAERLDLDRRMVELGVNSGLDLHVEDYSYTGPARRVAINRQALVALVVLAELAAYGDKAEA